MGHSLLTADILRLIDTPLELSQVERVSQLLIHGSPADVAAENGAALHGSAAGYIEHLNQLDGYGFNATNVLDEEYPHLLREVREAPAVIFTEGCLRPLENGVSIVGSREASVEALEAARQFAGALAGIGVPVISGLARGIDAAAHRGAIDAGGRTVAIVGTGLDITYPPEHKSLRERIVAQGGLIVSQFRLGSQLAKRNFPMRNAVMSGYGCATVVLAAGEQSGTKHQVKAAVKHGRPVIFTGKVANEVSWAREVVDRGHGLSVHSLDEAVETVSNAIRMRSAELSLF